MDSDKTIYKVVLVDEHGDEVGADGVLRTYEAACSMMRGLQESGFVAWVEP